MFSNIGSCPRENEGSLVFGPIRPHFVAGGWGCPSLGHPMMHKQLNMYLKSKAKKLRLANYFNDFIIEVL